MTETARTTQVGDSAGHEFFSHDADIGLRGWGPTPAAAFEQAALAMIAATAELDGIEPKTAVRIACEAPDLDLLLYEWLNGVVFEMAVGRMLFSRFELTIDGTALTATAWGETVDVERHQPAVEVKGVTLTELKVAKDDEGRWMAQCVVDV